MAIWLVLLMAMSLPAVAPATEVTMAKNPIRKVVTMLQGMSKTVTEEGEKEEKAFEEFMCYCKTGVSDLESSIESAKTKIETLESQLKETLEKKKLTEESLSEHKDSRAEAKEAVAKAEALRESENAAFEKEKSDSETNISAIKAAVAALEKGMGASFLQSGAAKRIAQFAMEKATMADTARQDLLSFLSGSSDYAPKSGEIVGILKQMGDEMTASLEEAIDAEEKALAAFNEMVAAKTKEINTLTAQIEEEMLRLGELNVLLAESGNDLDETKETLKEDISYLAELKKGCSTKEAEWQERCKVRQEELVAISETIKILNDDDALELFKKVLPSTTVSFLQVKDSARAVRRRALDALRAKPHRSPQLDVVMLAIQGKTVGFEKVMALIDDMMANLKKEQADDDSKKEYCEAELDKTEDQKKELERAIEVSSTAIEELKGAIATWTTEISDLKAGILALDKSVAEATKLRKEQNADYKQLMEENKATKEILLFAKNRLNKFYNPKLYKPPVELAQVRAHRTDSDSDAAPPPPPETFGAYTKKSEGSSGVIAMIDKLIMDTDITMKEAETEEKDAQDDYEKVMANAGEKRATDSKALTDKEAAKAEGEESLQVETDKKKDLETERMEVMQIMMNLHSECDWLVKYYDVRKAARADEVDALGKAKDVLSGADYSLLQTARQSRAGFLRTT
jgi:septal ring factor EnvC (AmiA/AmiB activator)